MHHLIVRHGGIKGRSDRYSSLSWTCFSFSPDLIDDPYSSNFWVFSRLHLQENAPLYSNLSEVFPVCRYPTGQPKGQGEIACLLYFVGQSVNWAQRTAPYSASFFFPSWTMAFFSSFKAEKAHQPALGTAKVKTPFLSVFTTWVKK